MRTGWLLALMAASTAASAQEGARTEPAAGSGEQTLAAIRTQGDPAAASRRLIQTLNSLQVARRPLVTRGSRPGLREVMAPQYEPSLKTGGTPVFTPAVRRGSRAEARGPGAGSSTVAIPASGETPEGERARGGR